MVIFENFPVKTPLSAVLLGIEFANTLSSRGSEQPNENLAQYSDLISWAEKVELIELEDAEVLAVYAQQYPEQSQQILQRAIALREAIYHLVEATKGEYTPHPADLETLNTELAIAASHLTLVFHENHFDWEWKKQEDEPDQILWPIAKSAIDLLDSANLKRVGICEDDACGWLFYDTSKNHSRRWCDMDDCGNRAKARRHYARKKVTLDTDPA